MTSTLAIVISIWSWIEDFGAVDIGGGGGGRYASSNGPGGNGEFRINRIRMTEYFIINNDE